MSFNADRAFEVQHGFAVKGGAGFYSGTGSPVGNQAPLNSVYRDSDNTDVWEKVGPLDTDWVLRTNDITVFKCFQAGDSGNLNATSSIPCTKSGDSSGI